MAASQPLKPKSFTAPGGPAFADVATARTKGSIDIKLAIHGSFEYGTAIAELIEHSEVPATIELLMFWFLLLPPFIAPEP